LEDWDQDNWIPFSMPIVPSFLALCALVLCVALLAAAFIFRKMRKDTFGYTPIPTSEPPGVALANLEGR
jgi:hypothetical protein